MKIFLSLALFFAAASAQAAREFHVFYDSKLIAQGFPSPVVDVTVNGVKTRFLVDTGAALHVTARWFCDQAKIKTIDSVPLIDSTGKKIAAKMAKVDLNFAAVKGADLRFNSQQMIISDLPEDFKSAGLAGIISPQELINADQSIRIDLKTPTMVIVPVQSLGNLKVNSQIGPENKPTFLYSVVGLVNAERVVFLIDSGADGTAVASGSHAGIKLAKIAKASNQKVMGLHGVSESTQALPGAKLNVFDRGFNAPVRLQNINPATSAGGILGMQVLKGCTLVLGQKTAAASCL